jgi:phosphate starvation-inducible PhoH-like protein
MSASIATRELAFEPVDNARLANFVGPMDENLRQGRAAPERAGAPPRRLGRGSGTPEATDGREHVLRHLFELSASESLTPDRVHLASRKPHGTRAGRGHRAPRTK